MVKTTKSIKFGAITTMSTQNDFKFFLKSSLNYLMGKRYKTEADKLIEIKSEEDLRFFQNTHLNRLIFYSYENVPYYRSLFDQINLISNEKSLVSNFNKIPILNKEIIRKNSDKIISTDYENRNWYYNSSGGSTGEPIQLIQDAVYTKWRNAINEYYYKRILKFDENREKKIVLWGSERDFYQNDIGIKAKINNWLTNTVFLNTFRMKEEDMDNYLKIINSYNPYFIKGYAGALYELCKYAERKKIEIKSPNIVLSAAENLKDEMREEIESIFGTKVYNFYGSREVSSIAGECEEGKMHIFSFYNYLEILNDNNQPVKRNEEGNVVLTNLFNYSMPLIRYKIGDMAILDNEKCKCGNPLPILKKITGRITDNFRLRDGTVIPGEYFIHFIGVVYNKGFIKQFQVIQLDYDKIKILTVLKDKKNDYQKFFNSIETKIKVVCGKDCKIIWEFVDDIPKTKSGKYIYTKSLVHG